MPYSGVGVHGKWNGRVRLAFAFDSRDSKEGYYVSHILRWSTFSIFIIGRGYFLIFVWFLYHLSAGKYFASVENLLREFVYKN